MKQIRLKKEYFDSFFALLEQSFPPEEYRKKEKQLALLEDSRYEATVLMQNDTVTALIGAWKLDDFIFIEHLAVSPALRNKGIGSTFVSEYVSNSSLPVVLEVENINEELPQRRIGFYKRLGFVLTDVCYDQPNFIESNVKIPLRIMYHAKEGAAFDLSKVKDTIFSKIYKQ